jgi:hypothetical protein
MRNSAGSATDRDAAAPHAAICRLDGQSPPTPAGVSLWVAFTRGDVATDDLVDGCGRAETEPARLRSSVWITVAGQ